MVSASRLLQPRTFAVLVCLWGLLASSAQGAEVRLSASSSKAWVGLPLTVTLEIRNASSHDAPLLPEVDNADVQSRGQIGNSTQLSIINGRRSQTQTVTYAWDLTPRAPGPVSVPPFAVRVDGLDQQVLGMTLDAATPEVGDRVSVEVRASDTEVYVGQPLELTLELNVKAFTDSRYGYAFTANNHWSLIDLQASRWGPFAASLNETRGSPEGGDTVRRPDAQGQPADYFQYRVRARVYPDRAGPLELAGDGVRIVGQYPEAIRVRRGAFGDSLELDGALPVAVRVPNPKVNVRPVPTAGRPDTYRGAVGRYRITAAADPLSVAVGDAVTLQLIVVGDGPLDRLSAPPLEAIPELTRDFDVTSGPIAGVVQDGAKVFTTTIRPRREDVSAVPAIPLVSFDLDTESFVTTASEPITLAVRPAERLSLDGLTDGPDSATAADPMPDTAGAGVPARPVWLPLPARPSDGPVWPWIWPVLYVAVPGAAGLAWGLWRGVARLRGRGGAVAARAVARARRRLRRARDAEGVAAALRGYVAQTTGRSAAALTAADAHAALAAQHPDLDAEALSTFAAALRAAEAAACGAAAAPTEALAERGRSALDAVTARRRGASVPVAVLCLLGALSAGAQADPPTSAPAAPGVSEHRASAQRFAQAPPGAASLINAATAWNLADQPARARAAALSAVRWDPASSRARVALADAEAALGIGPAWTAPFDRWTAGVPGGGGRRVLMAAGLVGMAGAGAWWWLGLGGPRAGRWVRGLRPWVFGGGWVFAAAGGGLSLHTAFTVPEPETAVLLDPDAPPRSGPGADFPPVAGDQASAHLRGALLRVTETRGGWARSPDGWRPAAAVARVSRQASASTGQADPPR